MILPGIIFVLLLSLFVHAKNNVIAKEIAVKLDPSFLKHGCIYKFSFKVKDAGIKNCTVQVNHNKIESVDGDKAHKTSDSEFNMPSERAAKLTVSTKCSLETGGKDDIPHATFTVVSPESSQNYSEKFEVYMSHRSSQDKNTGWGFIRFK